NTYTGGTNINGGVLAVASDQSLGSGPLTFNGGTLEALNSLVSTKPITLNTGGGTFLADANTMSTLTGSITGPGGWTTAGTGTLQLSGTNTYTGNTTVNAGTLQAGSLNAFSPSSAFFVNTGSVLDLNGFNNTVASLSGSGLVSNNAASTNAVLTVGTLNPSTTFSGILQDGPVRTLGLTITGSGTLILTGNNTYTGNTTISVGTLQLGNGGTSGGILGNVSNNGILSFDRSDTITFNGVISGTGSLQQNGTGVTVLTANNSYTGNTTIFAGTLQLGNGGTSGGILGNVSNNGILSFDRSDTVTFNGVIGGTGSLQQNGTGVTVLTANNSYTGNTTVNAGGLIVDGSIGSLQTFVTTSGFLGGKGLIGGNLVNGGLVRPGDSPGTLSVSGNYTQNSTGTLHIEIAGLASGQHDLLAVGGHATLAGTLQLVPLNGFQLHIGDKVTFLTANNGVTGNFSTIQNEFASVVNTQVVVLPTSVELESVQGSFVPAACTPNTVAVARALDSAAGDPRAATLIAFLDSQPFSQLCSDFSLISPEELTSIFNVGISSAGVQASNLTLRMRNIQAGSTGFSSQNFMLNGVTPSSNVGLGGPTGDEGRNGPSVTAPVPENRWGIFVTGLGEFVHVDSTDIARGVDVQTGGFTLGVGRLLGTNIAIGLMAGYAHTNGDYAGGGNLDV
ncbi:MAG: autotransporter-associated beta strand repeat-containing protein, partial [Verrucomicrobia bacterium]|nr:autotransporter-associated beta strand repeat-containing protein [Verrucomicrobiota bacterium]